MTITSIDTAARCSTNAASSTSSTSASEWSAILFCWQSNGCHLHVLWQGLIAKRPGQFHHKTRRYHHLPPHTLVWASRRELSIVYMVASFFAILRGDRYEHDVFQKPSQSSWPWPLVACLREIKYGCRQKLTAISQLLFALEICVILFFAYFVVQDIYFIQSFNFLGGRGKVRVSRSDAIS